MKRLPLRTPTISRAHDPRGARTDAGGPVAAAAPRAPARAPALAKKALAPGPREVRRDLFVQAAA